MNNKKKKCDVVQIGTTYGIGAPGSIIKSVHEYVSQKGMNVRVITPLADQESRYSKVHVIENKLENFIRRAFCKIFGDKDYFYTLNTIKAIKLLKKYKPHIIHINVIHNSFNTRMLLRYIAKTKAAIIFSLHDMWLLTGGCTHYYSAKCDRFINEKCLNCKKIKELKRVYGDSISDNRVFKEEIIRSLRKVSFHAVSQWVKTEMQKTYLLEYPITVIYNSVDSNYFYQRNNLYFNKSEYKKYKYFVVGVAAFWSNAKGLDQFRKLASILGEEYCVYLVGQKRKEDIISEKNIIIAGRVNDKNVLAEIYSSANVFVHLSKEETFGNVLIEAASCGKIVVGYSATGVKEVVQHVGGVLCEPDNCMEVAEKIKMICKNNQKLDQKIIENIKNDFSIDKMVKSYYELYLSNM